MLFEVIKEQNVNKCKVGQQRVSSTAALDSRSGFSPLTVRCIGVGAGSYLPRGILPAKAKPVPKLVRFGF